MEEYGSRAKAHRQLGIAEKQLQNRDLVGSREFVVLAQETASLLDGSDLILAIVDVLPAVDKRINNHHKSETPETKPIHPCFRSIILSLDPLKAYPF